MSCPGFGGYTAYYDNLSNDSEMPSGYATVRSVAPSIHRNTTGYANDTRSTQRVSQDYGWPNQNTQGFQSGVNLPSNIGDTWNASNSERTTYDYQKYQSTFNNGDVSVQEATQGCYENTSQASQPAGTQVLSSLAYASGLESAGLQNGVRQPQRKSTTTHMWSTENTGMGHQQLNSQIQNTSWDYRNTRQNNVVYPYTGYRSEAHKDLAVSAAAALAEAVSRKYHGANPTSVTNASKSRSPAMGNSQSLGPGSQPGFSHTVHPPPHANRQTQSHTRQSASPVTQTTKLNTANRTAPPHSTLGETPPNATPNVGMTATSVRSSAQHTDSIAHLVTQDSHTEESTMPHLTSVETSDMPNYINPGDILTPYWREHERAMREAETPAKKNAEETQLAAVAAATAAEAKQQSPPFNGSIVPPRKSRAKSTEANSNQPASDARSSAGAVEIPATEEEMGAELMAIMEKIKTFKDKDPELFQKLWENMRQPAPTAGAAPAPSVPARPTETTSTAPAAKMPGVSTPSSFIPIQVAPAMTGNEYKVVVENNPEALPDLGRFPAGRRIRASYKKPPSTGQEQGTPTAAPVKGGTRMDQPMYPNGLDGHMASTSAPSSQPLPPRTANGSVIWPEAKRSALADAAIMALRACPENTGIPLAAKDIHDMLDLNPSYIGLCLILERRGFRFDRGSFARHLLNSVPQLSSGQQPKATPAPVPKQELGTPIINGGTMVFRSQTGEVVDSGVVTARQHTAVGPAPTQSRPPQTVTHQPTKPGKPRLGVPTPPVPAPPPGTKEAKARKRDFSEIVDLTELGDDDNYVVPPKQPRLELPRPGAGDTLKAFPSPQPGPSAGAFGALQNASLSLLPRSVTPLKFDPSAIPNELTTTSRAQQKPRLIRTRPLNKAEALRKFYYDPKTVARDVLIAAGRHPTERPLNAHMAGLLGRYIELDSDLTTFNWEEFDPGGPPAPKVAYIDVPAAPPRYQLGDRSRIRAAGEPLRGVEPRRDQPKEDKSGAGSSLHSQAQSFLSPFATHAKSPLKQSGQAQSEAPRRTSRLRQSHTVDDNVTSKPAQILTPPSRKTSTAKSRLPDTLLHPPRPSSQPAPVVPLVEVRRRGRPPGANNKNSPYSMMKSSSSRGGVQVVITTRTQSPTPTFPVFRCRWRFCNTELHNLATLKKHISKVHHPEDPQQAFCWWKRCSLMRLDEDGNASAEFAFEYSDWLDHIEQEHLTPLAAKYGSGPSTSHIGKPTADFDVSKYSYQPPVGPETRTCSYLDPQTIALDRIKYLADEEGRQTTYPATPAAIKDYDADTLVLAKTGETVDSPLKNFLMQHGNDKLDPKLGADQTMLAMVAHKQKIGPGLDRGGCTLVNEERRATLLHSAGIARVVEEDY